MKMPYPTTCMGQSIRANLSALAGSDKSGFPCEESADAVVLQVHVELSVDFRLLRWLTLMSEATALPPQQLVSVLRHCWR